jgi:hypothetical protein
VKAHHEVLAGAAETVDLQGLDKLGGAAHDAEWGIGDEVFALGFGRRRGGCGGRSFGRGGFCGGGRLRSGGGRVVSAEGLRWREGHRGGEKRGGGEKFFEREGRLAVHGCIVCETAWRTAKFRKTKSVPCRATATETPAAVVLQRFSFCLLRQPCFSPASAALFQIIHQCQTQRKFPLKQQPKTQRLYCPPK